MKRLIAVAGVLALASMLASAPGALADDTVCEEFPPALTGTFDNIIVPPGGTCVLVDSTVRGNVKVRRGAALFTDSNTIYGSVQGDKPALIGLLGDTVFGNVKITGATGSPDFLFDLYLCFVNLPNGNVEIEESIVDSLIVGVPLPPVTGCGPNTVSKGKIEIEENETLGGGGFGQISIGGNIVRGSIQVFKNRGSDPKGVQNNNVRGSIQCFGNKAPFTGSPNTGSREEGQCAERD